jgi:hypothetical protein
VVRDVQVLEPVPVLLELQSRLLEIEPDEQLDPEAHFDQRGEDGERAGRDRVQRQHPDQKRGADREEDQQRRHLTATKTTARTASAEAIASA